MGTALKWGFALVGAGIGYYMVLTDKLEVNGKFLGLVDDSQGFGLDDIARGGAILGFAFAAGMAGAQLAGAPQLIRA